MIVMKTMQLSLSIEDIGRSKFVGDTDETYCSVFASFFLFDII